MANLIKVRTLMLTVSAAKEDTETNLHFDQVMEGTEIDDAIDAEGIANEVKNRLIDGPLSSHYVEVTVQ
jgi:hypothetical protein